MHFQFNSDNRTDIDDSAADEIEDLVRQKLDYFSDRLTRVELHVGDVNGPRGGDDIRCVVELRPTSMQPISATGEGGSLQAAVAAATDKAVSAFKRQIGKQTTRKGH